MSSAKPAQNSWETQRMEVKEAEALYWRKGVLSELTASASWWSSASEKPAICSLLCSVAERQGHFTCPWATVLTKAQGQDEIGNTVRNIFCFVEDCNYVRNRPTDVNLENVSQSSPHRSFLDGTKLLAWGHIGKYSDGLLLGAGVVALRSSWLEGSSASTSIDMLISFEKKKDPWRGCKIMESKMVN